MQRRHRAKGFVGMERNRMTEEEWELFELITSVHGGKQMYFRNENETVYSRWSHKYMTYDEAIDEFLKMIGV